MDNSNNNESTSSSTFDLFNSFKNLDCITIIKSKEDDPIKTTTFIPPNEYPNSEDGIIISKTPTIIEFPKDLPQDALPCSLFLRKFISCHSPSGFINGIYMYGENKCHQEDANILNCYQIQFSSSRENRKIKMDEIEKERIQKENDFYKDHIWKRRYPLIFKTHNEKEELSYSNTPIKQNKIDNQLFGYSKELFDFLSNTNNENEKRISEIKVFQV